MKKVCLSRDLASARPLLDIRPNADECRAWPATGVAQRPSRVGSRAVGSIARRSRSHATIVYTSMFRHHLLDVFTLPFTTLAIYEYSYIHVDTRTSIYDCTPPEYNVPNRYFDTCTAQHSTAVQRVLTHNTILYCVPVVCTYMY